MMCDISHLLFQLKGIINGIGFVLYNPTISFHPVMDRETGFETGCLHFEDIESFR